MIHVFFIVYSFLISIRKSIDFNPIPRSRMNTLPDGTGFLKKKLRREDATLHPLPPQ
jgi:hypothetical protein